MSETEADAVWASSARRELVATLRRGEAAGFAMRDVLAAAVRGQRGKAGDELAADLANELGCWPDRHSEDRGTAEVTPGWREPVPADDPAAKALRQVETVLAASYSGMSRTAHDDWQGLGPIIEDVPTPGPAPAQPVDTWTQRPHAELDNDLPTHRDEIGPGR